MTNGPYDGREERRKTNLPDFDLFGEPAEQKHGARLAEEFVYPPFSVLSARDGWWQERKRQWLALGILSELGRGGQAGSKLTMSETVQRLKPSADQSVWRHRND